MASGDRRALHPAQGEKQALRQNAQDRGVAAVVAALGVGADDGAGPSGWHRGMRERAGVVVPVGQCLVRISASGLLNCDCEVRERMLVCSAAVPCTPSGLPSGSRASAWLSARSVRA